MYLSRKPHLAGLGAGARIGGMDKASRREHYRAWIAVGVREGLEFTELARRSGLSTRTLYRWNSIFRKESQRLEPSHDEDRAFVQLVERIQGGPTRIEVYLPGEPRLVIDGAAVIRLLGRMLRSIDQ
jgi:hypothetical protein